MKDIKVIFRGNKSPSGMDTNKEYYIGAARLKLLEKADRYDMELTKPKAKSKSKKKSKKEKE